MNRGREQKWVMAGPRSSELHPQRCSRNLSKARSFSLLGEMKFLLHAVSFLAYQTEEIIWKKNAADIFFLVQLAHGGLHSKEHQRRNDLAWVQKI